MEIREPGTNNNTVSGNFIGTDVTGTASLGNANRGISINVGAQSNTIGGSTAGERNIISGNGAYGISFFDLGTENNKVVGNYIGTDVTGTVALGNLDSGIFIGSGARSNIIGGTTAGERNIISRPVIGVRPAAPLRPREGRSPSGIRHGAWDA